MEKISLSGHTEPFWDYYLVDKQKTTARLSVNSPKKEEVVFRHKNPLGREIFYPVVFRDGDIYRMYYGTGFRYKDPETGKFYERKLLTCYAESRDGLQWDFPALDVYEGTNCVLRHPDESRVGFDVFKDTNPACDPAERYKGITRVRDGGKSFATSGALVSYVSPDGIHFKRKGDVLREPGKFDSLNTVFWDQIDGEYKVYYRDYQNGLRAIFLITSKDFVHWEKQGAIRFDDEEPTQLYTNNIMRYPDAPQIFIGLPVRYTERSGEWIPSFDHLPDPDSRKWRLSMQTRFAYALTDALFMTSRDGVHWHKFNEAIADGGIESPRTWKYGDCYFSHGFLMGEDTVSCYAVDSAWDSETVDMVRYSFRKDGFASFKSGWEESVICTKPFSFEGARFFLNFRTSAAGAIHIQLTDEAGNENHSCEIFGNSVCREIAFEKPLSQFSDRSVTMKITLKDAEVFSFKIC